jgi:hypothetical protein
MTTYRLRPDALLELATRLRGLAATAYARSPKPEGTS